MVEDGDEDEGCNGDNDSNATAALDTESNLNNDNTNVSEEGSKIENGTFHQWTQMFKSNYWALLEW